MRLVRPAEPERLIRYRDRWTSRWTDSLDDGRKIEWATRVAKATLRDPLLAFAYAKCAFCENRLNLTSFVEIEHYHSKIARPELVFNWHNLFPICGMCNQKKGDVDHGGVLLKPDLEDTEVLLWLHPGTGELQPHPTLDQARAQRVLQTAAAYDLQRGALCEARIRTMEDVNRWLKRVAREAPISDESSEEWNDMIDPFTPLKFVIRHVLTLSGQVSLAETDRRVFLGAAGRRAAAGQLR